MKYFDEDVLEIQVDENDVVVGITKVIQDLPDEEPVRMECDGAFIGRGYVLELIRVRDKDE